MSDVAEAARLGYAQGWIESGGPMTERVRAGCAAAMTMTVADPELLEVTIDLGHLEGTWAQVYDRRHKVYDRQLAATFAIWRRMARRLDLTDAVARYRSRPNLDQRAHRQSYARDAAAMALIPITADPDYEAYVSAIADALADAQAEGVAGAVGIAASQNGRHSVDYQAAYDDAAQVQPTASSQDRRTQAASVAAAVLAGTRTNLARSLAKTTDQPDAEAHAEAQAAIGADDDTSDDGGHSAAALILDQQIGRSFMAGALGWFVAAGARTVNWVTAGVNTCLTCESYEDRNPWLAFEVPDVPVHPRCRCTIVPADDIDLGALARYLVR